MNHMANEFFFEGHEETQAPWRFHENYDGREYLRPGAPRWAERSGLVSYRLDIL